MPDFAVHRAFLLRRVNESLNKFIEEERLFRSQKEHESTFQTLIQEGGYVSPNSYLWEDVLISIILKKPLLLKGPTGSGKTKLAQSVSRFFNQPMHSVNCSVDLDAESLLGFKTIIQKDGVTTID